MPVSEINEKSIEHFYLEKDGITYTEKSPEMKLNEGLITNEQYNEIINNKRQQIYKEKTDPIVMDIMRSVLNRNTNLLNEKELLQMKNINDTVENIKEEYPKELYDLIKEVSFISNTFKENNVCSFIAENNLKGLNGKIEFYKDSELLYTMKGVYGNSDYSFDFNNEEEYMTADCRNDNYTVLPNNLNNSGINKLKLYKKII